MSIIIAAIVGAAIGGGAVHYWHIKHLISINPRPNTGSGDQPPGGK